MTAVALVALTMMVLLWSVFSSLLARWNVSGPMLFTATGILVTTAWGRSAVDVDAPSIHLLAEVTLALLLFSDAARVNLSALRRNLAVPVRLLGFGLPLSILLGTILAAWLFQDFTWALAGFVAATLAPTDAALSAQVINDQRVPMFTRRALNVESGLNDGLVTPVVVLTLAVVAGQLGHAAESSDTVIRPLLELGIGVGVGVVIGLGGAWLLVFAFRRGWTAVGGRRLAALATALASFSSALAFDGNAFVAAFVAGLAFGSSLPRDLPDRGGIGDLPELGGEFLALVVWFLFGAALVPLAVTYFSPWMLLYAFLSLTVIRMLPVALALIGTRQDRSTILFIGWFGPRGLASVVFALLAVEELGGSNVIGEALGTIVITVLFSVIGHGVTAAPFALLYARNKKDAGTDGAGPRARRQIQR
ncbi:MAG: cation:proton antiporter [Mycetocola sp.]